MGSINRVTLSRSIWVSSSFTTSSKVKPYWKPEQPPPLTNTRSLSSGEPSSSINSLTFFAALSVKTSGLGISVTGNSATVFMVYSLNSSFDSLSNAYQQGSTFVGHQRINMRFNRHITQVDQLAFNHCSGMHFQRFITDISRDTRF